MLDKLQDKVFACLQINLRLYMNCIPCKMQFSTSAQVNYLDNRISSFAADFEAATGCAATHPVYAACQVCHMHLLLVHCAFQSAADPVVPACDKSALAHLTTVGQVLLYQNCFGNTCTTSNVNAAKSGP